VVEHLLCECKALTSNSSPIKGKQTKTHEDHPLFTNHENSVSPSHSHCAMHISGRAGSQVLREGLLCSREGRKEENSCVSFSFGSTRV
jgi:hypothetical protein